MDNSKVYIGEIRIQVEFAERSFAEYLNAMESSDVSSVFYHAHHFLIHATNIDKLIDVHPDSFRSKYLTPLLSLVAINLKQFRRLRNHLEHFDERLDDWVKTCKEVHSSI